MKVTKYTDDLVIEDLRKKVQFYEREFGKIKDLNRNKVDNKKVTKQGKIVENSKK